MVITTVLTMNIKKFLNNQNENFEVYGKWALFQIVLVKINCRIASNPEEKVLWIFLFGLYCLSLLDENPQFEIIKVTKTIGIPL